MATPSMTPVPPPPLSEQVLAIVARRLIRGGGGDDANAVKRLARLVKVSVELRDLGL